MKTILPALLLLLFLTACAAAPRYFKPGEAGPSRYTRVERFGGHTRKALVCLPSVWRMGSPRPLVLALHGRYAGPKDAADDFGWAALAEKEGFIAVFPKAAQPMGLWSVQKGGPVDDAAWLAWLASALVSELGADPRQVFLVGHSIGGMMVHRVAAEGRYPWAGAAAVASSVGVRVQGLSMLWPKPKAPLPFMLIHGLKDKTIPASGGKAAGDFEFIPFEESLGYWREANRCGQDLEATTLPEGAGERRRWTCGKGAEVQALLLEQAGHEWPGSKAPWWKGPWPKSIDASAEIWRFFSDINARNARK